MIVCDITIYNIYNIYILLYYYINVKVLVSQDTAGDIKANMAFFDKSF